MKRRGTIVLALFLVIAGGIIGASVFLRSQPPIEITFAVDPLAEAWLRQAAQDFNASSTLVNNTRRARINLVIVSDVDVWRSGRDALWTAQNHPAAWIPASTMSVTYARGAGLPLTVLTSSTARTPLVWGGYASRVDLLTDNGAVTLDWEQVASAARTESWAALGGQASWQFVNLAFSLPDRTTSGLAVLLSGAAAFNQTSNLTGGTARDQDFYAWMEPVIRSVPNFNSIGGDTAAFMARGASAADIGIGPESQWLTSLSGLLRREEIRFSYPARSFTFDFPVALWDDSTTTSDQRAAARAFADWLLQSGQQASAGQFGLRPVNGAPAAPLFDAALPYGIQLDPVLSEIIQPPSFTDAQSLIQWFTTIQRR